jgi:hypothetical protein
MRFEYVICHQSALLAPVPTPTHRSQASAATTPFPAGPQIAFDVVVSVLTRLTGKGAVQQPMASGTLGDCYNFFERPKTGGRIVVARRPGFRRSRRRSVFRVVDVGITARSLPRIGAAFSTCERLNPKTRLPEMRAPVLGVDWLVLASISFEGRTLEQETDEAVASKSEGAASA